MIKLFVSDMDGTLLNDQHIISQENANSIKKLQARGIEFMIATGRTFHSAKPFLDMHQIDCEMINLNGAAIYSRDGHLEQSIPMSFSIVKQMILFCQRHGIGYSVMDSQYLYVMDTDSFLKKIFANLDLGIDSDQNSRMQFINDINYVRDINDYRFNQASPVLKMMILSENPEKLRAFQDVFASEDSLDITSSNIDNLEVTHQKAQKGLAIASYAAAKGWTMDEVATIGDSLNDRSMLQMAKYGFVMENASEEVKSFSTLRAPDHNLHGVSQIIEAILKNY
ncbi:Cof-type HAD-IIB family hydrolase [Ignavigranum ruoffiae]|uniref:Cof-type HAD-IIB family hydrolase n=1 Tax=Ignavigranum ruoffiae TaxID=89093 RepID=UPI003B00E4E2